MDPIEFTLGLESIKGIPFQKYENDFTFIVNEKTYQTNRFVADILSPNIKKLHYTDSSINEYHITTNPIRSQDNNDSDYFLEFLQLASYQKTVIDSTHRKYFSDYFYQLGNIIEYIRILQDPSIEIAADNIIDRLLIIINQAKKGGQTLDSDTQPIKEIISFIASHFEDINKDQMKKLKPDMLYEILQNDNLILSSEDSLLNFILSLYKEDYSYSVLFEYVIFNNISQESLEKFVNEIEFDDMSSSIWKSICKRLVHPDRLEDKPKRYNCKNSKKIIVKNHEKGNEFNGIFHFLTTKTGGNIHDNGTIKITSDSVYQKNYPHYLVDFNGLHHYESATGTTATIIFDFLDKKVLLESYTLKSLNKSMDSGTHIKSWVIETSNDAISWEIVDEHKDDPSLNGPDAIATFKINKAISFYRYIRLRNTGPTWIKSGSTWAAKFVGLDKFEIYGKLKLPDE